ncbi:putative expressed protein [Rosellinia necatrix]|uniref:Putative expressed protein n=1 Tax=Rosellinia necatrix TaxID=77044 RepID=A0A1W2TNM6_ROSNE|nr:putative expressed protein [Rosellinia necatrix]
MSAGDLTGFDASAESMARLSQHKQIPDPMAAYATAILAHKSGYVPERLEVILSKCQTDSEIDREIRDDFEIHRLSAHTYLNQYLDCLEQVHHQHSRYIYEIDESDDHVPPTDLAARTPDANDAGMTREQWRLKISRDSLARDLLAMHETLECLRRRAAPSPRRSALPVSAWSIPAALLGCILWQNSRRRESIGVLAAQIVYIAYYYRFNIWEWRKTKLIERRQGEVEALLRRLNKGEVDREDLHRMSLWRADHLRK